MELYEALRGWFWNERFWLPAGKSWTDFKRSDEPGAPFYPDFYDLWIPFPIAVGFFVARLIWERYWIAVYIMFINIFMESEWIHYYF